MIKSAMIRARVEEKLKFDVEKIFEKLGLNATEAITLYYKQIKLNNGLPFSVKIPTNLTKQVFTETDSRKNIIKAKNVNDLFNDLAI